MKKEFIRNDRLILKSQLRFRNKKHNVFIEEINKIALVLTMIKQNNQSIK